MKFFETPHGGGPTITEYSIVETMKVNQPKGTRGSLRWIQVLVNNKSTLLNQCILDQLGIRERKIEWVFPIGRDNYAEYRDGDFLGILGLIEFKNRLKEFWPRNGPQWDALGRCSETGPYFLVEAKANIPEIMSNMGATSEKSIALIRMSLSETRKFLKCKNSDLWEKGFYQYANRLAHLYLLRVLNQIPAYLVFVYFLNDHTHISTSKKEWAGALNLMHSLLGSHKHKLSKYVIDVFIDIKKLGLF